jgi:mevalonate kinase
MTLTQQEAKLNMKVFAPGKLILSGEHAVVYGKPALAMAINRYTTATITHETLPRILLDLSDIAHRSHLSFSALKHFKERIKHKYHRFVRGDFSIREVLQKPFELAQFAMGIFAESLNLPIPHGVKIHLHSDIPMGCGMGSSAATILSVMLALSRYMEVTLSAESLFEIALKAENMQHGYSSGLDLRIALEGGCLYVNGNDIQKREVPTFPMFLINTGIPATSTGQCVEKVAPYFASNQLADEFAAVTIAMDAALQQSSISACQAAIKQNHQLLTHIGVVPTKVQKFVKEVEALNGAAKICGAGATVGDRAGAALVIAEDKSLIALLCARYGYNVIPILGETRGAYAA